MALLNSVALVEINAMAISIEKIRRIGIIHCMIYVQTHVRL